MSGRASSTEGLLKGFRKAKEAAAKTLDQAAAVVPAPAPAASPAARSGPSLGESLIKAFTTSPKQIAAKPVPVKGTHAFSPLSRHTFCTCMHCYLLLELHKGGLYMHCTR